ncbi:MAG: Campylobacter invasion antigen B (CiaB) [uncultured Sulfurovum sp.]|uniref:Campylobacter invasion antigen B (CiaB) n=1 Tax=uncultured Sulfurovum sp. TaxID=269237 RepID=A0A6S6T3Z5_9BACT|nr:MAG: Campylobacter invasion antigen B (CiaB) [uncultured Sulfurovum sp.]
MNKQQFMQDLQTIYDELQTRQAELNSYYDLLDKSKVHERAQKVVDAFLTLMELPKDKESQMAALTRVVNLREDVLVEVLVKSGLSKEECNVKKELAYGFVSTMHINRHESFINWVEAEGLLTPFYRSLMLGVHTVGVAMSQWQSHWTDHIIHTVNLELNEMFNADDAKVFEMLQGESLLDTDESGCVGDRCYSVLQKEDTGYKSVAYAKAFPKEVAQVTVALEQLIALLSQHEDDVFEQKTEWIAYFSAIKEAFEHTNPNELIGKWAEVDRKWMAVKTPLQVGHPLEYYEDHYRKAVALEWDLRIVNPNLQEGSPTRQNIKDFASSMAAAFGSDAQKTMAKNLTQVDETQLYIGQPILYYAAEFNGLFSAQVVPNDEQVSAELGKKIFAYADFVMESKKSKPMMKLNVEMMGEAFVQAQRILIDTNPKLWQEIYDISTVGHEYGHILWIDSDTEMKMNGSGQFKNIEEFKATAGGLMAFFHNEKDALKKHIVDDVVSRAVGLMAWREVGEVLPYYCEGLIHLDILFGSGIIMYDEQVKIDYAKYEAMKEAYQSAYKDLAENYLNKVDANVYLSQYTVKRDGVYLPKNEKVMAFVEHYYARYKEIGQQTVTLG